MSELTKNINIASAEKQAELNIWLEDNFKSKIPIEVQILLMGVAVGIKSNPEIDSSLSDRAKMFLPSDEKASDFIIEGAEVNGIYREALYKINLIQEQYMTQEITEEEAIEAIKAVEIQ